MSHGDNILSYRFTSGICGAPEFGFWGSARVKRCSVTRRVNRPLPCRARSSFRVFKAWLLSASSATSASCKHVYLERLWHASQIRATSVFSPATFIYHIEYCACRQSMQHRVSQSVCEVRYVHPLCVWQEPFSWTPLRSHAGAPSG